MILKKGDNIFVAHRRLFDGDAPRFFVGQVDDYEVGVVKARGYSYVWDEMSGLMLEKPDARTRILALSSGTLMVYQLPDTVDLESLRFVMKDGSVVVTDRKEFTMNLAEHAHDGRM
jgi:hypothetical protein